MSLQSPASPRTLILLDVDGVLVHPRGYKAALTATVNRVAEALGLPAYGPDEDEIATFEACGITNEWDSGAMCASMMLQAALRAGPDRRRESLEATFAALRQSPVRIERPDFVGAARRIADEMQRQHAQDGHASAPRDMPSRVYFDLIAPDLAPPDRRLIAALLDDVYNLATLTTRTFQAYTLGSAHFQATYGEAAPFDSESFLITRDQPLLGAAMRERLVAWHAQPQHGAVIFTARPSLPPDDLPPTSNGHGDFTGSVYSPEAELAAELLGLDGAIPLIAQGRIGWIAQQYGRQPSDYVKPSPVQALAAIGAAAFKQPLEALQAAAALVETGELTGPLAALAGGVTRVILFEDSITGIRAVDLAAQVLRARGIEVECQPVGISPHAAKRATLAEHAEQVVDDINQGLALVLD